VGNRAGSTPASGTESKIKRLVYINEYKDTTGVDFLRDAGVDVLQIAQV
jgi:hypothetical protein